MTRRKTRTGDPTQEEMQQCIEEGYCWWCNTSGWIALAIHTYHAHGISADDMRELALVTKHTPTCIPSYSHVLSLRPQNIPNVLKAQAAPRAEHHTLSKAGLIIARANLAKVSGPEQRSRAGQAAAKKSRKPHPCPACGKMLPTSSPITCSPECRKVIRQRTALITKATKDRLQTENPEYRSEIRRRQSERIKKLVTEGKWHIPTNSKPHSCPVCGTEIPSARPKSCSSECLHVLRQRAQVKSVQSRKEGENSGN